MTCEELLQTLNDYVDGDIDPAVCEEFQQHLAGCNPCQVVVENIRDTISLYRNGQLYEMPPEFHERLRQQLKGKWAAVFDTEAR
jgi:anti-sigma factor RsiW